MAQKKVCKGFRARCAHGFTVLNSFYLIRVFWVISLDIDKVKEPDPREQDGSDLKEITGDGGDLRGQRRRKENPRSKRMLQ
jgi:hypothetical protein